MINFAVKLAVTAALAAAQVALQMSQRIKGPRLEELTVSVADYGTPIPRFWGIRRFECPIIWAEDLHEVHQVHKSKGGKYDEYKYFGTFAITIADQEIDAVTRIWMDHRLVYDVTSAGVVSIASLFQSWQNHDVKLTNGKNMRVYLGTETQVADPRYTTWCEDRYGPDSAPAYRGVSYIVFEELPLEKFGNRIPQVTVEAVSLKTATHPYQILTSNTGSTTNGYAFGGTWLVHWDDNGLEWWDLPTRTNFGIYGGAGAFAGSIFNVALSSNGTAYYVGRATTSGLDSAMFLYETPPLGVTTRTLIEDNPYSSGGPTRVFSTTDGTQVLSGCPGPGYNLSAAYVPTVQAARDFCIDDNGTIWVLYQPDGASSDFTIETLDGASSLTVTGSTARSDVSAAFFCYVSSQSHFYVAMDGYWYLIDASTGAIKDSGTQSWDFAAFDAGYLQGSPGSVSFWSKFIEVSLEDGSTIRTLAASDWVAGSQTNSIYDPVNHAIISHNGIANTNIYWRFLDRITSDGVSLQTVVDTVCEWCNLTDKDTAALTQIVQGYSVTQGSGKDMIEPLLTIHDVDCRPHDFTVQFVNRGSSPSGTILTEDFVRNDTRYKVTIRQDTDLPKKVTFKFADKDNDQQTNTVIAQRPLDAMDSQREETIDLTTYVATTDEAQKFADRYFRRVWNSREQIELSLTAQYLGKEPGDVTTLSLDGTLRNARIDKMTIAGQQIDCTFTRDETSFAVLNSATGPDMGGRDDEVIYVPSPVRGFVIDGPLLADADNDVNPLVYTGAGSYGQLAYPGAAIYRGDDGTYDELFETVGDGATWGICTGTLGDANPNVWDRGNTLNVSLQSGTLNTVTEAEIDADPSLNLIVVGQEYLNFTTATLEGDGTYTLSGFKRGRRGTEWATGDHAAGDTWVLASSLGTEALGTDDIGDALSFKAQAVGRDPEAAVAIDLDPYSGATLKPYAPARLKTYYDGTDVQCEIIRRTRVGGSWNGGSTIPLSENSEEYEVDVYNGATLKRTITVTDANTFTYTAAMAASDGITLPTLPTFNVYQMSDAVGRGYALAA